MRHTEIKEYPVTYQKGLITFENIPEQKMLKDADFGILIAKDGRVWICINGASFLRFKPMV